MLFAIPAIEVLFDNIRRDAGADHEKRRHQRRPFLTKSIDAWMTSMSLAWSAGFSRWTSIHSRVLTIPPGANGPTLSRENCRSVAMATGTRRPTPRSLTQANILSLTK